MIHSIKELSTPLTIVQETMILRDLFVKYQKRKIQGSLEKSMWIWLLVFQKFVVGLLSSLKLQFWKKLVWFIPLSSRRGCQFVNTKMVNLPTSFITLNLTLAKVSHLGQNGVTMLNILILRIAPSSKHLFTLLTITQEVHSWSWTYKVVTWK